MLPATFQQSRGSIPSGFGPHQRSLVLVGVKSLSSHTLVACTICDDFDVLFWHSIETLINAMNLIALVYSCYIPV
jgi:hypothetical protein